MANQKSSDELQAKKERELTESEKAIRESLLAECDAPVFDENRLGMIEDGSEELSDDLFFELLRETPSWLGTTPFLKRIAQWQLMIINSEIFDKDEQQKAKANIVKIATALTPDAEKGRPTTISSDVLYAKYDQLVKDFTAFFDSHNVPANQRMTALCEEYPQFRECLNRKSDPPQHRTPDALAVHVLTRQLKVSERTLYDAIKKHSK